MKFYKDINIYKFYYYYITSSRLTCIHIDKAYDAVVFYKNGKYHNNKNASYFNYNGFKHFCLDGKLYGNQTKFTKKSWRKFVKLKAFL
jgi:hypothetical protein